VGYSSSGYTKTKPKREIAQSEEEPQKGSSFLFCGGLAIAPAQNSIIPPAAQFVK
jgi:hypothetical protein